MKFTEYINFTNVQKLLNSNIEDIIENSAKCETNKPWETKYIVNGLKKMKTINIIKYRFGKNYENGRQYSTKLSLQGCPSNIRGFITQGTGYRDYDMFNAYFAILVKLCSENNIPCLYIKQYLNNREQILKENKLSKRFVLAFLHQDKPKTYDKPFLIGLDNELKIIKPQLISIFLDKISQFDNKKNPISSQMSQILNCFENEALMKVVTTYKLKDAVLIYDGFMTRTELPVESLEELTGYKWVTKDFPPLDIDDLEEDDEYTIQKGLMEENNFVSLEPFTRYSRINENYDYVIQTKQDFEDRNAIYQIINDNNQIVPIMKKWLEDPNKRTYDKTVFDPDPNFNNKRFFNLFKPFDIVNYISEDGAQAHEQCNIDDFHTLIHNLSGGSQEPANEEYLLNWLAHLFQKPHINPQTCVVLKGKQGNGKDSLTKTINLLFGEKNNYLTKVSDIDRVVGNFTETLDKKLVVQLNEMEGKDGVKFQNRLKDLITTEYNLINRKYQSLQTQVNYIRWIIFSNTITPVVVELSDRRFFICETDDANMGNHEFWNRYYCNLDNKNFLRSIYDYLMERDITRFNPKCIPKNNDKVHLQLANINPIHKFLKDEWNELFGDDGNPNGSTELKRIKQIDYYCIKPSKLYWSYQDYEDARDESEKIFKKIVLNLKGVSLKRISGYSVNLFAIRKDLLVKDLNLLVPDIKEETEDGL